MNSNLIIIFLLVVFPLFFVSSFASIDNFTTDKTSYYTDDSIIISGNVDYDPDLFSIIVQIITPSGSGLAHVDSVIPNSDGTFTKIINAGGPTWSENGNYKIKISYGGNLEKFIEYQKSSEYVPPTSSPPTSPPPTSPPPTSSPPTSPPPTSPPPTSPPPTSPPNAIVDDSFTENPKMRIFGFPAFDKSPQYYVDRYNNEPSYKTWFDSQFPGLTIYAVLGFSTYIPDRIKDYARNWATGEISDNEFMIGLDFMIQNKIIVISDVDYNSFSTENVPSWFRNTSHWWSNDLISQQEFINSIKYLIQEDIILIE